MTPPAAIEPVIEAALARVACELAGVAETLAKIAITLEFIASAQAAK